MILELGKYLYWSIVVSDRPSDLSPSMKAQRPHVIAILTEGTDIPCIDCILLTRPTRSATLFQQMFGRGLRLFPDKENCLVIDFVDNFKRTGTSGLITVPTLLGLDATEMVEGNNNYLFGTNDTKEAKIQ